MLSSWMLKLWGIEISYVVVILSKSYSHSTRVGSENARFRKPRAVLTIFMGSPSVALEPVASLFLVTGSSPLFAYGFMLWLPTRLLWY